MTDQITFDEDNGTWLLTLPAVQSGGRNLPACTIVAIRTLNDVYFPASGELSGNKRLTERTCTLTLHWDDGNRPQVLRYKAHFRVDLWNGEKKLDLTNSDFLVDYSLRGRGLGSWIMQQLIAWARTLPADTPVKCIKTSPVDEDENENRLRRDRFWYAIGFRFPPGERTSLPLCVSELQYPRGRHQPLTVVALHTGVAALHRLCERQKRQLETLEERQEYQTREILSLSARQWDTVLLRMVFYACFGIVIIPCRLFMKMREKRRECS
ncbi:hypothetical protein B2M27_15640 (plasmid) [Kluyvera intermedia]|uniref:N-acetyltransferase domain-containing protein n=1 Tax=Kluyvera intermedia TaxID=61648 RepID=A0ABX3UD47_KLUIN|nr:GNAT family N-acetyltransferase [Kluyvera intermedia]ORJ49435.1 hypothetical protein B2M27_15640 [Kluyvera intermedia]